MIVRHRDLDPVEAAIPAAARCLAEGAHEFGNLIDFQLVRNIPMHTLGNLRRRQKDIRLLAIGLRTAPEVRELGEHETSVVMDGVGYRVLTPAMSVKVDIRSRRILEFTGASNLLDEHDRTVRVRTTYTYR